MASAILAIFLGSQPGIPIAPLQNATEFALLQQLSVNRFYNNHSGYSHFFFLFSQYEIHIKLAICSLT